ncbi:molybdate ABC transporter substrate-binding protein [Vibrio astriarenae]
MKLRVHIILLLALQSAVSPSVFAQDTITIAVANNFYRPMIELAERFEQQSGITVNISTGSSGQLATQILHGAPFDLFFSADQKRPSLLVQEGKAHGQVTYAQGVLVLWIHSGAKWEAPPTQATPLTLNGKVAIADPKLAPYGEAAVESLNFYNSYQDVHSKALYGKGLNATYQYAATGNAQYAFLASSQLKGEGNQLDGTVWLVPQESYSEIKQDVVYVSASPNLALAEQFILYLHHEQSRSLIERYGYNITMG